ncbi:MAG TPA: ABC transporter permease [Tepidisphaeraceae bacterium]|nr:ABC transporter permease [Tepidisphaeraceae bacterium]
MSRQTAELPLETSSAHPAPSPSSPSTGSPGEGWSEGSVTAGAERFTFGGASKSFLVPAASLLALAIHFFLPNKGLNPTTDTYPTILIALLTLGIILTITPSLRRWSSTRSPLLAAAILVLLLWELITIKLNLLPLIYFPPPETVFQTLIDDRRQLWQSTWHSLTLLLSGYFLGTIAGLVSGITIGWSSRARYWGMPILKIVGPIPATAWIPLALILFPQSIFAGMALIALAVWFPLTMLSASGISNVRASYLDVAKTLGAGRSYLIFRVAIPAAMPSIFIGLFMGLGTSFLTLLVAESTGVSAGLGWYIDWARNYSDYNKVFAALLIMSAFFSGIMTLLFFVRDRALVWQKGVIKW